MHASGQMAASRQDTPAANADTALSRSSIDDAFDMPAGFLTAS